MADAAMASLPAVGPTGAGLPTGGLEALKYAAQADMFQDDPKFYTWLEDWIGKQDEESIMIDAFNTLTDFGMQFDFQQQQQLEQQQQHQQQPTGCDSELPTQQPQQPGLRIHGGDSSCASLVSQPSSQPSDDASPSLNYATISSPSDSSSCKTHITQHPNGLAAPSSAFISFGTATIASQTPAGPAAAAAAPAASLHPSGSGGGAPPAASSPFDMASFGQPLSRGLGPSCVPPELLRLMSRETGLSDAGSALLSGEPISPSVVEAPRIPSHGTVSSYVGAPLPPSRPAGAVAGAGDGGGGGLTPPGLPGTPSLEQLVVRAICGNGSGSSEAARGASLGQLVLGGGRMESTLSGMGLSASGGSGGSDVGGGAGVGLAAATATAAGPGLAARAPSLLRNGSDSCMVADDGAPRAAVHSMELDSLSGSGRMSSQNLASLLQQQQQQFSLLQQLQQPLSALASAGGPGIQLRGTSGSTSRHPGPRRKSSSNGINGASYGHGSVSGAHHHHGIPVSHAHGHGHVGKAGAAGPGGAGGGGYGTGWGTRGSGGVNSIGKPTRSARAKAIFTALEAEVASKMCEVEALQREHATLTQRVEILEVALERQNVVLDLLGRAGNGAAAAAAKGTVPRPLPSAAGGNGELAAAVSGMSGMTPGSEVLEWARTCTIETYIAWYKDHLQNLSLALLALEDSSASMETELKVVQLVAACWVRTTLVCIFQPLTQLRLKGFNLETGAYQEPQEQHWMEVIKFMTVSPEQVAEMENLFHSYNLLHGSFRAELQDTQRELTELVVQQDAVSRETCSRTALAFVLQQTALLKRVRNVLQKTHLLYSSTIGVAALRILKPKEFAKCQVQSYPYFPCGPSLMRACFQLRAMKAIWGPAAVGSCGC